MHRLLERQATPLFGNKDRAEKIVKWSMAQKETTTLSIKRGTGISLELQSKQATPRVLIYFRPEELRAKLNLLGPCKRMHFVSDGISISVHEGLVKLNLLSLPRNKSCLWQGQISQADCFDQLLGMIELAEDGVYFYSREECPATQTVVKPLQMTGTANTTQTKPLSLQAKKFLLRDGLVNMLLQNPR